MADKRIKKELIGVLGKGKVFDDQEFQVTYAYDATGKIQAHQPDWVVFPDTNNDVENILKVAFKYKIPVTPRGAGVGYSGGSVPVQGGIALVFTRMNRILEIDTDDFLAVVEPGVITYDLQEAVKKAGLFYPPDPASLKTSTIGGNVAENAGGPRCFKYGVTRDYVIGLEAFLINGEKINFSSRVIKNVAGYDIKSLLVGSEGTLAVITRVVLRLLPLPEKQNLFQVHFHSLAEAVATVQDIIKSHIFPSVLEFMDKSSIAAVCRYLNIKLPEDINATLLIEIDGLAGEVTEKKNQVVAILNQSRGISFQLAEGEEDQDRLWHMRRNISPAIATLKPLKINEDIVVPLSKIPSTVAYINNLSVEMGFPIILFGHIGDGNIHTNLMVDPDNPEEMNKAGEALDKIFRLVVEQKGSITGEHGVGLSKKAFLPIQFSPVEIDIFKRIKEVFDPHHLLNPGKIF